MIQVIRNGSTKGKITKNPLSLLMRIPLLNHMMYCAFSTRTYDKTWTISDEEQKAIISYYTIRYIISIDAIEEVRERRTIRERIFTREHLSGLLQKAIDIEEQLPNSFNQKQIGKSNSRYSDKNDPFSNLMEAGFKEQNIDKVLKGFDLGRGIQFDQQVYSQSEYVNAMTNGLLVLHPSFISGQIMKSIIYEQKRRFIVQGQKGCGKSFAYLLYNYLSTFIVYYQIKIWMKQVIPSVRFKYFIPEEELQKIKKLFYAPFTKIDQFVHLIIRMEHQCHPDIQKPIININATNFQHDSLLDSYVAVIQQFYSKKNIQTVFIVDQINDYFSLVREMVAAQSKLLSKSLRYSLYHYYCLFYSLQESFNLILYNSSQYIDVNIIQQWNRDNKYTLKCFDLFNHNQDSNKKLIALQIQFCTILSTKNGHIYFYDLLWERLCSHLTILMDHKYSNIRQLFDKTFGIYQDTNPEKAIDFKWWKYDMRFSHIDDSCRRKQQLEQLSKALINNDLKKIAQIFQNFQKYAEENRKEEIQSKFMQYYSKGGKDNVRLMRFQILLMIKFKAQDENHSEKGNHQISLELGNLLYYYNLLQYYKNKFNNNSKDIVKEIENFTDYFGTGYNKSSTQIRLLVSEQSLEYINKIIDEEMKKQKGYIDQSQQNNSLTHKFASYIFDMLLFQLFELKPEELRVNYILDKEDESITRYNKCIYNLKSVIPFHGKRHASNTKLEISFDEILKEACNFPQQIILGYPVKANNKSNKTKYNTNNKTQQSNLVPQLFHFSDNALLDFILVSKNEKQKRFYIKSFDTTIGSIQSKIIKTKLNDLYNLQRQLRRIAKMHNATIQWQHNIYGPKKRVQQWYKKETMAQVQLMYKNQKIRNVYSFYPQEKIVGTLRFKVSAFETQQTNPCMFVIPSTKKYLEEKIWKTLIGLQRFMNNHSNSMIEGEEKQQKYVETDYQYDTDEQIIKILKQLGIQKNIIYSQQNVTFKKIEQNWELSLMKIDVNLVVVKDDDRVKQIIQRYICKELQQLTMIKQSIQQRSQKEK